MQAENGHRERVGGKGPGAKGAVFIISELIYYSTVRPYVRMHVRYE